MDQDDGLVRSESARLLTAAQAKALHRATSSGIRPEEAQIALREWIGKLEDDPRRFALLTLILVTRPPQNVRRHIASALTSWHGDPASADADRAQRERAVADALGSVRAEGLEPSAAAHRDAAEYEAGRMSAEDLRRSALRRAHSTMRR